MPAFFHRGGFQKERAWPAARILMRYPRDTVLRYSADHRASSASSICTRECQKPRKPLQGSYLCDDHERVAKRAGAPCPDTRHQLRALGSTTARAHLHRRLPGAYYVRSQGTEAAGGLFGPDNVTRTLSARYYKDGSEVLVAQRGKRPRRLTPLECARLMGFDRGERRWKIPVSDTQAYRQFGNAVVVPVVEFLTQALQPHLEAALAGVDDRVGRVAV